jgi:transposase InsO family protein
MHKLFAWPSLKQSVQEFVQQCDTCQRAKVEHTKLPGLLQPLPVPAHWNTISLDFVEGLPISNGHDVILVVIDKLTKYAHFLPLKHPFTALQVAMEFTDNIYKLHGLPECIISDRDKIFTSKLWQEMFRLTDTQLMMSSSYHPQTDGQTERLNQCLETFLRCTVHACPTKWFRWLPLAEFWYNTSFHSALGRSLFEALYGHPPRHFGISTTASCSVPDLEYWLQEREVMTSLLRQ